MKTITRIAGCIVIMMIVLHGVAQKALHGSMTVTFVSATEGFNARTLFANVSSTAVAKLMHTPNIAKDSVYVKMGKVGNMPRLSVTSFDPTESFSLVSVGQSCKPLNFAEFQQTLVDWFSIQSRGQKGPLLVEDQRNNVFFVEISPGKTLFITFVFLGVEEDSMWFFNSFSSKSEKFEPGVRLFMKSTIK